MVCTSMALAQPSRSATSTRRSELELFGAPTTDQRVGSRRDDLHRFLPVGGRIADVILARAGDIGEARLQHGDDLARVVDRKRGLA